MSTPEALEVKAITREPTLAQTRRRRTERAIPDLDDKARNLCLDIIHGRGDIGKRFQYTNVEQHREELLSRISHPLVDQMVAYTEAVLPTDVFLREDGNTPHVFHSYRVTNLLLDYLPFLGVPKEDYPRWVATALGHDNTEDPQELLIKINDGKMKQEEIEKMKDYAITPAHSRKLYKTIMTQTESPLPAELINQVFTDIQILNRFSPDNTKLDPRVYLDRIIAKGLSIVKVTDIESAYGDMARIVREIRESREGKRTITAAYLEERYKRLDKSMKKVAGLHDVLGPHVPNPLKELMTITIRAGELFRGEVDKYFAEQNPPSPEITVFQAPRQRER